MFIIVYKLERKGEIMSKKFIPKVCRSCEKNDSCTRESQTVKKCYIHWYNTTRRDRQAETGRQVILREQHFDRYMLYRTRHMAKKAGIPFSLTLGWFKANLQRGTCQVTGLEFVKPVYQRGNRGQRGPYTPSVDRIDNTKGYTPDNCRMVIWMANLAKNSYSDIDFARLCKAFTATELSQQL